MAAFSLGLNSFVVPMSMHAENRSRLTSSLSTQKAIILFEGGSAKERNDTDHELLFRQESYFQYLFGVKEPGFWGAIHVQSNKSVLFCPRLPAEYQVWMGNITTPAQFKEMYEVDEVLYVDEMETWLAEQEASTLLLLEGKNSDSGSMFVPPKLPNPPANLTVDTSILFPILANQRVYKTDAELALMKHVSKVTSLSHVATMRTIKPGMMEYQAEATFHHYAYFNYGCRNFAYTAICACGPDPAVLHYGHAGAPNDRKINDGDMALMDMGAEYHCYASDITCSWPVNGRFTDSQKIIYGGVLEAQRKVYEILKPGTSWVDCHRAAEKAILAAMVSLGVLRMIEGVTLDEMVEMRLGGVFMPHGLGHFIGLDTHDVGGYLPKFPERPKGPGLKSLRTARTLDKGMCLTVEPGCYFIDYTIDNALADPNLAGFIVPSEIDKYRGTGGVRLEDVLAITEDGFVNYTVAPRGIDEVEMVMGKGGKWPPVEDKYPELRREDLLTM